MIRTIDVTGSHGAEDRRRRLVDSQPDPDEALFERLEHRLESLGILADSRRYRGDVERSMLRTLASRDRPIQYPQAFERAHHSLARAMEAIIVNGKGRPDLSRRFGPFRLAIAFCVQLVTRALITSQTYAVLRHVRRLYALREVNAVWNSPEHLMLRRARAQMHMLSEDVGGSRFGIPLFLLSGAFVSGILSVLRAIIEPALHHRVLSGVLFGVTVVVLVSIAGIVIKGASVARMRLRIALRSPVKVVYYTIGSTAQPPRDRCFQVAVIALMLFALAVIAIPSGVYLLLSL